MQADVADHESAGRAQGYALVALAALDEAGADRCPFVDVERLHPVVTAGVVVTAFEVSIGVRPGGALAVGHQQGGLTGGRGDLDPRDAYHVLPVVHDYARFAPAVLHREHDAARPCEEGLFAGDVAEGREDRDRPDN